MQTEFLVTNALIVTCDATHRIRKNAAMRVSGNTITWIGDASQVPSQMQGETTLDASGKILMPGLINMHAHCADSLFRGLVENLSLEDWLATLWKAQAVILPAPENCRLGAELGIAELLLGGTTTVMDNYWSPDQTFLAARDLGIRMASGGIFFDPPGMDGFGPDDRGAQAQELFDLYGANDEVFVGTMPHGTYTVGPKNVRQAIEIAKKNNGFFSVHAAETKAEQATIQARYQTSVIRHLQALGGLHSRSILAHCVHLDDAEIDLIASAGAHVAHNPLSNLKLASGFAPVPEMLARGINVTLGTDGAISGNDLDMWLAMRLAATMHKAATQNPAAISAEQALHMATLNGARALGAEQTLGSIEVGKRADFQLVDITGPNAVPMFNPVSHLVFSASKSDVTDVFVSGKHLVQGRKLLHADLGEILARVTALQPEISAALEG